MLCKVTHCSQDAFQPVLGHEQSMNNISLKKGTPSNPPPIQLGKKDKRLQISMWIQNVPVHAHIICLYELHFYVTVGGQGFGKNGLAKIPL